MPRLTDDEIRRRLETLPGWELAEGKVGKEYRFDDFRQAIAFVNRVADAADAADHHPDIHNTYDRVRLDLHTHSEGGVTDKDLALAETVERDCVTP
jgi:4a-hydroxytetrahydrobiopterin dehydratase